MNKKYGLPLSIYSDSRTVFHYNPKEETSLSLDEQLAGVIFKEPNFKRACRELRISLILAKSAQAKGRIERLWLTLQDRLPLELKRMGISNIADTNKFLLKFINKYNAKFAVEPENVESSFLKSIDAEELYTRFSQQSFRQLNSGLTFSYAGKKYSIDTKENKITLKPKNSNYCL
ncbi:hypothetical protein [Fastidiosipila sanguinis]|nr:hypothetical protein [Fastidiosipila sanguinis]